jgi:hypothetical protein
MEFISFLASPPPKSQCDFEAISVVHDSPDIADVGGQQFGVFFVDGFRSGYDANTLAYVKEEGRWRAFTLTFLLEFPHQPAEHDGHYADEDRSQAKYNIDRVIGGYVSRMQSRHS